MAILCRKKIRFVTATFEPLLLIERWMNEIHSKTPIRSQMLCVLMLEQKKSLGCGATPLEGDDYVSIDVPPMELKAFFSRDWNKNVFACSSKSARSKKKKKARNSIAGNVQLIFSSNTFLLDTLNHWIMRRRITESSYTRERAFSNSPKFLEWLKAI